MVDTVSGHDDAALKALESAIAHERPLLLKEMRDLQSLTQRWSPEYISAFNPNLRLTVKQYRKDQSIGVRDMVLSDYLSYLQEKRDHDTPGCDKLYCHDVPIFSLLPELVRDVSPFFLNALPSWYHNKWWRYVQFFMGPRGSHTPLHFDCLLTHNTFFQIYGQKRFILINSSEAVNCGRHHWRWFRFDPECPDYEQFPRMSPDKLDEVIVGPGDLLYMPPGTLHAVRGLEESISFNIDFHTQKSVLRALGFVFLGMPLKNGFYNFVCALGLLFKIPSRYLFPFYRAYLNYVS